MIPPLLTGRAKRLLHWKWILICGCSVTLTALLTNLAMMQVGMQFEIWFNKTEISTVNINKNLSLGYDHCFCCFSLLLIDIPQTWCTINYYHMTCVVKLASFQSNPMCSVSRKTTVILLILLRQFLSTFHPFSK